MGAVFSSGCFYRSACCCKSSFLKKHGEVVSLCLAGSRGYRRCSAKNVSLWSDFGVILGLWAPQRDLRKAGVCFITPFLSVFVAPEWMREVCVIFSGSWCPRVSERMREI